MNESEFSLLSGCDNNTRCGTVGNEGSHEDYILTVRDGERVAWWWFGDYVGCFYNGVVFPCQRRFVNFKIDGLGLADKSEKYYRYETDVGGDAVAYI